MARKDGKPGYYWYTGDWRKDAAAQQCSLTTRGFWRECLDLMHANDTYLIRGSCESIARLVGCTPAEAQQCLLELQATHTAEVTFGNAVTTRDAEITIVSRRLERESSSRKYNADKQKRFRERHRNEDDTAVLPKSNVPSSSSISSSSTSSTTEEEVQRSPFQTQIDDVLNLWNSVPEQWVIHARQITGKRLRSLKERLTENGWYDGFAQACVSISDGDCGFFGNNDRGWKPDLDFMLRPDSVTHILEGKYANGTKQQTGKLSWGQRPTYDFSQGKGVQNENH